MASEGSQSDNFQRALALIKVEQPFEALPLLGQVIESHPGFVDAYVHRARIRRRLNNLEGAIADYSKAIKLTPTAELYLARALAWLSLEKYEGAVADARRAVALSPGLAGGHRLLGKALGLLGDGVGAIAAYKQAARCYIDAKDKENAARCLEKIEPLKALPPLRASQQQAIDSYGSDAIAQSKPEDFLKRLWQKYAQHQYAVVLKETDWLLQRQPKNTEAICLKGLAYAQMGRSQQAVEEFAIALQLAPEDNTVRFYRAQMRLALSDDAGAVEDLSALIETVGPEARFLTQRAIAYQSLGELQKALADYTQALGIETKNADLYEKRAEVQQKIGDRDESLQDYQRAATLWLDAGKGADHQRAVEAIRRLRGGQSSTLKTQQHSQQKSIRQLCGSVLIKSYKNHRPVAEVIFNGTTTYDMVIDRNAPHSIITMQMADELNLENVSYRYVYLADGTPMELSIGLVKSVAIGETVITDVYVAIAPNKETALLGKDCFGIYSVRLSGNELTITR